MYKTAHSPRCLVGSVHMHCSTRRAHLLLFLSFLHGDDLTDGDLLVVGAFTSAYSNAFLAYSKPLDGHFQYALMRKISEKITAKKTHF